MGLGDVGSQNMPVPQDQYYDDQYEQQLQQAMYHDPWYGKPTSNMTERIVQEILLTGMPEDRNDLLNFLTLYEAEVQRLVRTPNIDMATVREIRRDTEDLMDRAMSEGREEVIRSKMLKHYKWVVSLSACGEKPLQGITAASLIVTNKTMSEQQVKFPQERHEVGFLSSLNPFRRR